MFDWLFDLFKSSKFEIKNEFSSAAVAKIAAKALKSPKSLTDEEIRSLAASVLTQRPNKK